jgi:hypothetical protein
MALYRVNLEAGRTVKAGSIGLLLHNIRVQCIYICISTKRRSRKHLRFKKKIKKKKNRCGGGRGRGI